MKPRACQAARDLAQLSYLVGDNDTGAAPNAGPSQASQAFWEVADVDEEIAALEAKGVIFEDFDMWGERSPAGAVIAGGAKAAWFKDSEGNIMALIETLRQSAQSARRRAIFRRS